MVHFLCRQVDGQIPIIFGRNKWRLRRPAVGGHQFCGCGNNEHPGLGVKRCKMKRLTEALSPSQLLVLGQNQLFLSFLLSFVVACDCFLKSSKLSIWCMNLWLVLLSVVCLSSINCRCKDTLFSFILLMTLLTTLRVSCRNREGFSHQPSPKWKVSMLSAL